MIDFKKKMEEIDKKEQSELGNPEIIESIVNSRKKKRIVTYTIALTVIGLIFAGRIIMSSQSATNWFGGGMLFNKLKHLVPSTDKTLKGEENDRINILLLGMGGKNHDGGYLSDTIIIASLKPSTKQVALISIPRDLTVPMGDGTWRKINNINAFAEAKEPGSGGQVTAQAISNLLDIPIDYYVRADFDGFINIIDELGGVEVNVENTLDDYSYPIRGQEDNPNYYARFEHLHLDKGWQKMDGSLALKYARSRHAMGSEGSDFARARRQQLILEAVKEKILSKQTLLNPVMIGKLISEFNSSISTNLNSWEILRVWSLFKDVKREQIISKVLSDAPDGLLVSGKGDGGAYILTPRSGNFSEIKTMIKNIFSIEGLTDADKAGGEAIEPAADSPEIIIYNGTWATGLAGKAKINLEKYQFQTIQTGNAAERNYEQTVVYDLSGGKKDKSLKILKKLTGAAQMFDSPAWLEEYKQANTNQADFFLILGTDYNKTE